MRIRTLILSSLLATAASACVITPYRTRAVVVESTEDGEDIVVVETAPPSAPYNELVAPAPYQGALWIDGYWGWSGHRHVWVAGRWERPRHGYVWRPHRWHHHHGRWHLRGGGWVRHHRG